MFLNAGAADFHPLQTDVVDWVGGFRNGYLFLQARKNTLGTDDSAGTNTKFSFVIFLY